MRLSTIIPLVVAFGAAAGGAFLAAGASVGALERSSARGVDFELKLRGHDWAEVEADGLQVVVSGEAPSEADRFRALAAAGAVVDAARVIDNMRVTETGQRVAPEFSVEILRNEAGISLIGLIPAETNRAAVLRDVERVADGAPITDLLEVADYSTPDGWFQALGYGMSALEQLPRSKISVSAERVEITAAAETANESDRLQAELSRAAPEGLRAAVRITAPRPVITPFTMRFLIDGDGARFDSCAADTEEALEMILAAAVEAGFEGKSECRIGLGTPTTLWGDAARASIEAVGALGSGTVTVSDTAVSLVGTVGTDQALFDRVAAELEAALPDLFGMTAKLPAPVVVTEQGPALFSATKSPEGQVQMRGNVGDGLAETAVETYAKARFGAGQAYLATEPHSDLPSGWSLRTLAGLAALSELDFGSVEVSSETLAVRGDTGNQEAQARIAQILSDQLGEGQDFSISVVYREELDPLANIPTPEDCLASITAITAARKLTFEPGSADLDADSLETIGAIALVLEECPEFEMMIEGHTDSQGREVMNMALSQSRAEAVVTALRSKRIAWPGLYPRGFGEDQPIADNETEEGREENRRIEFRLVSAEELTTGDGAAEEETADE
ncbi:MAG: OmpA family protein [Pseudomonadota bacterium]